MLSNGDDIFAFRREHSEEQRREMAKNVRSRHAGRIPVIIERDPRDKTDLPTMDKKKFLVPSDIRVSQLMYIIRKRLGEQMTPNKAMFLLINGSVMAPSSSEMGMIFDQHKAEDGFLYILYCAENTFGASTLRKDG